ncbi:MULTISPECIES: hypothetical protein [unclassified Cyanobium]|uniref:hypothetical protein n=1 Tax=unclassified Cyanobium TaxID=2627006 RepID=UPI0020CE294C|nr:MULTISPECIES: hypothetical protein [unclassified Cyanobium]MCP9832741.1 hypothetical protein [Cyanobium sp. La Preciosa 7G6]MCP9935492.1 hypothetical protein [Cyanobium sp. Aljojuca 7A6]
MKGQGSAIALVALWILGWGVGGSLIDAGLIKAAVYSLEGGQVGTLITFVLWSLLWGGLGLKLWQRRGAGGSQDAHPEDAP